MKTTSTFPVLAFATLLLSGCSLTTPSATPTTTNQPSPTLIPTISLSNPSPTGSVSTPTKSPNSSESQIFNVTGNYVSPDGPQSIDIKLTLANGTIQDVLVTPNSQDRTSLRWQQTFASGIREVVVGKKIADLKVGKVSGSSLTGQGFNAALDKIRAQM